MSVLYDSVTKSYYTLKSQKFRLGIEQCNKSMLPYSFRDFPKGSCGNTCLILAKYLQDLDMGSFNCVSGKIYRDELNYYIHAWLIQSEIIVDITADQFNTVQQEVIVSTNSNWYKKFNIESETSAALERYDCAPRAELLFCCQQICKCIK